MQITVSLTIELSASDPTDIAALETQVWIACEIAPPIFGGTTGIGIWT